MNAEHDINKENRVMTDDEHSSLKLPPAHFNYTPSESSYVLPSSFNNPAMNSVSSRSQSRVIGSSLEAPLRLRVTSARRASLNGAILFETGRFFGLGPVFGPWTAAA